MKFNVPKTIEWVAASHAGLIPGHVRLIDQTRLPMDLVYLETTDLEAMWEAIKQLKVRGAPAIGVAAAMALPAHLQTLQDTSTHDLVVALEKAADYLATSRPTAVNLFWALDRMRAVAKDSATLEPAAWLERLAAEAVAIRDEDAAMCRAIGSFGVEFLRDGATVLTHCNAGSLATAEFGTALSPIYTALEKGLQVAVYADETRPLLQGAHLTAWELMQSGADVTLICDNMAAQVMKEGRIDCVMVGSDRIASNGDVANKIGTYSVALAARAHHIPFYVLAPTSTFDMDAATGDDIPIEERDPEEVTCGFGTQTAPTGVAVYSPAFDVTPADLVTAIICEKGIARPDYKESLRRFTEA